MDFDFDFFSKAVKMVYPQIKASGYSYTLDDVLHVFRTYFAAYEEFTGMEHPRINVAQIKRIIERMPVACDGEYDRELDVSPEDYDLMIAQHFMTEYDGCDYNINHFFSGAIRYNRYRESCE